VGEKRRDEEGVWVKKGVGKKTGCRMGMKKGGGREGGVKKGVGMKMGCGMGMKKGGRRRAG
jgi:hypothetical protein